MKTAFTILSTLTFCALVAGCDFNGIACKYGNEKVVAPSNEALALLQTLPEGQRPSGEMCAKLQNLFANFSSYAGALDDYTYSHYATKNCVQEQDNSGCYYTPRGDQVCYWSPSTCLEYGPDDITNPEGYKLAKALEDGFGTMSVVNLCDQDGKALANSLSELITAFGNYTSTECVAPRSGD